MSEAAVLDRPASVLLVDDERTARLSLAEILSMEGYQVTAAGGGQAALQVLRAREFDLVLCDLKMPMVDGLEVLAFCRDRWPATEVVLLTAYGTLDTAVEALRRGASDYLLKPARPDAVMASLDKALLKRSQQRARRSLIGTLVETLAAIQQVEGVSEPASAMTKQTGVLEGHGIVLDQERRIAVQDGSPLALTPTEFDLLVALMQAAGRPIGAKDLVVRVLGYVGDDGKETRSLIRVHVSRLRQKIEMNPAEPQIIVTVRGSGYAFGGVLPPVL